ncbi:MAG: helix-turn-helix transcriptional regulator [Armatimonadetes bacterium]|nr:helix-turn-helix transcriptional regulator [Armatimonadota bacterium]
MQKSPRHAAAEPLMPPAARKQSRLLEPAILLLLLETDGVYGYEMPEQIAQVGLTEAQIDASAVYRSLRWLESHEQVRSTWDTTGDGHPRRRYYITELGVKALSLWADVLRRRQEALSRYMVRYREGVARYRKRRDI